MGSRMLQDVRQDLTDVVQVCEGKKKQTNVLRTLINDFVKGGLHSVFLITVIGHCSNSFQMNKSPSK